MKFTLTKPCKHCPFRTDIEGYLHHERAREIADALIEGRTFACHLTTVPDDDEFNMRETENSQHCAGALIMLEHMERPNQMMRWMERISMYDRTKLKMDSPVVEDDEQFVEIHAAS